MRLNTTKKKSKKKDQSIIEKELMSILRASLKECIDKALEDVLKGFNTK